MEEAEVEAEADDAAPDVDGVLAQEAAPFESGEEDWEGMGSSVRDLRERIEPRTLHGEVILLCCNCSSNSLIRVR